MDLDGVEYYHGNIRRVDAEDILKDKLPGSFLLRKRHCDNSNAYAISVAFQDQAESKVLHYEIKKNEQNGQFSVTSGSLHPSVFLLCEHYRKEKGGLKKQLLHPVSSAGTTNTSVRRSSNSDTYKNYEWYHGKITREEDGRLLSSAFEDKRKDGIFLVRMKNDTTFVLSLVYQKKVHRYIINQDPHSKDFFLGDSGKRFASIESLLEYHKNISVQETGLQCQPSIPCCQMKTKSPKIRSFQSFARQLRLRLPGNAFEIPWSETGPADDSEQASRRESQFESKIGRFNFNRKTLPKDSIGYYSPYRNIAQAHGSGKSFAPDLCISEKKLQIKEVIGKGNFGNVNLGECDILGQTHPCAVKILSGSDIESNKEELLKEAQIMQRLDHPHIVRLLAVCIPKHNDKNLMMILELAPGGSFREFLMKQNQTSFPEASILLLMKQVADGMAYLAHQNVVHRDLASRNILLVTEMYIKISDFGMSRILQDSENYYTASKPGSWPLRWYAPEALEYYKFTSKTDVWSFGITLWEAMSYGGRPYRGMKGVDLLEMLRMGHRLERPRSCSSAIYSLMLHCWEYVADRRPSFNELLQQLDSFLQTYR
ncbi:tyrosine-protein kinase SYK-like [Clavelina lepadiformis]|uniref:tyrosine-protein kinase SYK-like n=1 Tax=Clavelina lepadiformis TaxID=159417 RepID=UPI004041E03D